MNNFESLLENLNYLYDYDPETGKFISKVYVKHSRVKPGDFAGTTRLDGYRQLNVNKKGYTAHRLAWLIMTGKPVPEGYEIDHINRIRDDNRWCNLRLAIRTQNNGNQKLAKHNTSGVKGVYWDKRAQAWCAQIKNKTKSIKLGYYDNIEEAAETYKLAAEKYFGKFANPERKE